MKKIMNQNMSCHLHILNIYSIKLYTCNHCIFYYIYSRRIIQWFIKNFQCGKLFLFIYLHKRNTKLRKLRYDSFWPSNNFPSGRRPPCIIGLLERSYNMFTDHPASHVGLRSMQEKSWYHDKRCIVMFMLFCIIFIIFFHFLNFSYISNIGLGSSK